MKKIISLILSVVMIFASLFSVVLAENSEQNTISVYVTISKYGEFIKDKNDSIVAMTLVELSGKDSYVLDDVFKNVHENLFESGLTGYETQMDNYGLSVSKFWGDTSKNFMYQVNFGQEEVYGPNHEIENGDCIEFCINKSGGLDMEVYTRFDRSKVNVQLGETVDLVLSQAQYTASGLSFVACTDAVVTINGALTENVTDADGKTSLVFNENGEYAVSAVKTKLVNDETVTAIEAPVCLITVGDDDSPSTDIPVVPPTDEPEVDLNHADPEEQMHNIVEKYLTDSIVNDGNFYWFAADFSDYLKIYPESEYAFSASQKQNCIDKIIEFADSSVSHGELAKSIIALRALGYDAKNTYKKSGLRFDIVAKLTSLINEESVAVPYYEYTLPYVLIALEQGENYASQEIIEILLDAAIASKDSWQDTTWGIDGAAPMLRALAPYYDTDEEIIGETVELIKAFQGSDGSMGNAASTGLAIVGLSAVGVDPETVLKDEKTLIDGLMKYSNESADGFLPADNSFGTEQGLRGLVAWKLLSSGKMAYDFKDCPMNEARATREVVYVPSGGGGSSSVKTEEENDEKEEQEVADKSPQGLIGKNEDVKILPIIFEEKSFEDIESHQQQKAIEELAARGIINGKTEKNYCPDETMSRAEFATIVVRSLGLPEKIGGTFDDVAQDDWFNRYVNTAYGYGIVNGVSENEFNPYGKITREEAVTMILRAAKLCGMKEDTSETGIRNTLAEFSDYIQTSEWAMAALAFCYNEEIIDKSALEVKPKEEITRADVAQMLYNMLGRAKLL